MLEDSLGWGRSTEIASHTLFSQFEFECRARGADILAYPPVVAGGNRSNTLHYVKNNQLIKVISHQGTPAFCSWRAPSLSPHKWSAIKTYFITSKMNGLMDIISLVLGVALLDENSY